MTFVTIWTSLTANLRSVKPIAVGLFWILSLTVCTAYLVKTELSLPRYPFITDKNTIKYFNRSKIIVLENSSRLRENIRTLYGNAAYFCLTKNKSGLVREIEYFGTKGKNVIVVNRKELYKESEQWRKDFLDPLPALAEQFKYALFIANLKEDIIPLYTGWLLNEDDSKTLSTVGRQVFERLLRMVPSFFDSFKKFSKLESVKEMLSYYHLAESNANGMLHCTAKYLANGTAPGSREYWKNREVRENLSRCYSLNVIGLFWTPRTFGARVKLTKEELRLWDNINETNSTLRADLKTNFNNITNGDGEPDFAPVKGRGSRAHLTLGVAKGVAAVVTGLDLLEIVHFESEHRKYTTYYTSLGWLRDYGSGIWVLYSAERVLFDSMFAGVYNK